VQACSGNLDGRSSNEARLSFAGDQQTADVAVAAVWGLVKGNQKLLRPEAEALGAPGTALAGPLLDIVLRGKVRSGPGVTGAWRPCGG
jgi:hypothetical protein